MANLRTAFLQAYHSGNPFFFFLSGLPCLLQSLLTCEEKSPTQIQAPLPNKNHKKYNSFLKIQTDIKDSLHAYLFSHQLQLNTLHEIMSNQSCDFKNQKDQGNFVHAIQLINEEDTEFCDLETIHSEYYSQIDQAPCSTQISALSEMNLSDIQDYQLN